MKMNGKMSNILKKVKTQEDSTQDAINGLITHIVANLSPEYQKTANKCKFIIIQSDSGWSSKTPNSDYIIVINTICCNNDMWEITKTIYHELYHCHNGHCDMKTRTVQQELDAENFAISQKNNFKVYCNDLNMVRLMGDSR